jgi:hypothetical protein
LVLMSEAEDLPGRLAQLVRQHHGDAVGFLAARAGRAPDAECAAGRTCGSMRDEELEVLRLAEKIGFVGGQQVDRRLQLDRLAAPGDEPK